MKKNIVFYLALILFSFAFQSCEHWEGETVESSYILPTMPDPSYQFKRNGGSSVDYLECSLLRDPIDYIYNSYLKIATIMYPANMDKVQSYYTNGEFGLKPKEELAASSLHQADRTRILKDVEDIFTTTGTLSGLGQSSPGTARNRRAIQGIGGYVGTNIGDVNIAFANDKGLVVAEMFNGMMLGGIYLDKILNVHLNDSLYNDVLRESRIKIYNAFALGRLALTEFRYQEVQEHLQFIRAELSKVVAVRTMSLLVGEITLANLDEDINNSLVFLSKGCGSIYSLQFTLQPSGKPYFTYNEVKSYINLLTSGKGLWDKERLLGSETTEGSLKNVAASIGKRYGLTLDDIKHSN